MDDKSNNHRRSFLGRRGTYQVTAPPVGVPGEPSSPPPPPTEPPPSLSYTTEKAQMPKVQLDHEDNQLPMGHEKTGRNSLKTQLRASTESEMHKYSVVGS